MSSDATIRALGFATADDSEELARAELYGLLARLWQAPPDAELLQQFAVAVTQAPEPGGFLEAPWHDLVAALRNTPVEAAAAEFDALFGGVGKPDIFAFGSYYLAGYLNERPLALLRQSLIELGLSRGSSGSIAGASLRRGLCSCRASCPACTSPHARWRRPRDMRWCRGPSTSTSSVPARSHAALSRRCRW